MRYLPDANIFIKAAQGDAVESKFLNTAIKKKQVVISTVVIAEFLVKSDETEEKTFKDLLSFLPITSIDSEVAQIAAQYRKESLKVKRVQMLDCFLAAQARLKGLILVTNNKSDFPMKDIKVISP